MSPFALDPARLIRSFHGRLLGKYLNAFLYLFPGPPSSKGETFFYLPFAQGMEHGNAPRAAIAANGALRKVFPISSRTGHTPPGTDGGGGASLSTATGATGVTGPVGAGALATGAAGAFFRAGAGALTLGST